jgi:dihydrofolate reductase
VRPLTLIVAMTPSGVIGKDGGIPWHVSEDMKRFKRLTTGHAIIMGRKTYESIGKPLPNRTNVIVTHKPHEYLAKAPGELEKLGGAHIVPTLASALDVAYGHDPEPFVIGGAEIYALALPFATRLEVTNVARVSERDLQGPGCTYFPQPGPSLWDWKCIRVESAIDFPDVEFMTYERRALGSA